MSLSAAPKALIREIYCHPDDLQRISSIPITRDAEATLGGSIRVFPDMALAPGKPMCRARVGCREVYVSLKIALAGDEP